MDFLFYVYPAHFLNFPDEAKGSHFLKLSRILRFLYSSGIKASRLPIIELEIQIWISEYSTLYGDAEVTFIVHSLLHLPRYVRNFGPLWTSSCYPFEGFNKLINSSFNLTTYEIDQIICRHKLYSVCSELEEHVEIQSTLTEGLKYLMSKTALLSC